MDNLKKSSESLDETFIKLMKDMENSPNASVLTSEASALKSKYWKQIKQKTL